jgi:hypothetical protein
MEKNIGMSEEESRELSPSNECESIRRRAHRFVCQVMVRDFKLFLDSAGAQKVLDAYQPMGEYSGRAIARNFVSRLELGGKGADVVAIPVYAFTNNVLGCSCDPIEIRERGIEVRITSCVPSRLGSPPEYCIAISHNAGNGIAREINPEFEMVFTHHLAQGDPYCRYVVKRKSDRIRDLDDLGELLKVLPPIDLPEPEKESLTTSYNCSIWLNIVRAMLEVFGSENTMALLGVPSRTMGEEFGDETKKALGIEDGDAKEAESIVEALGSALGQEHNRLEDSAGIVRTEIHGCALADGPIEACRQFEWLAIGICESINPNLEITYDKMRTKGDKTCHWTIRKRGELSKESQKEGATSNDPSKRLANKLIDGEISEEEFERKMALLRKHSILK